MTKPARGFQSLGPLRQFPFTQPNRALREARGTGYCGHPTVPKTERLSGRPYTPASLVQFGLERLILGSYRLLVGT